MSKRLNELGISADMKIETKKIISLAEGRINAVPSERRIYMRYKKIKALSVAAAILILCLATAFAADNIISYFSDSNAKKIGDIDALTKYNEPIGTTDISGDKILTLDNLAIDDSYLYVFFTLRVPSDYEADISCMINGQKLRNWSSWDSYMIDETTGKGAFKISVAHMDIPDTFDFEMYCSEFSENSLPHNEEYYAGLSDKEKEEILYIKTTAHKAQIKAATITKEVNTYIQALNSTIDKIVISPFGSQLVIKQHEINRRFLSDSFAVQDENGKFIHVGNETTRLYEEGDTEEIRTVPIMLGGEIPESLTIIPYFDSPEIDTIAGCTNPNADVFPFDLNIGNRGKVVVTAIRYYDAKIEIDYRLEGETIALEMIYPITDDGSPEIHADDGVWCIRETEFHQSTESYTETFDFVIGTADQNGNVPSAGALRSADILKERFKGVGISYKTSAPELDYDNAVKIEL